jgi:heme exporter protein B
MTAFLLLLRRELRIAVREGGAVGTALGFFLILVALLPLGLGPDLKLLSRIAPGVLWIGLLLAALLSLGRMFETDHEDGSLEVMATGPLPLELIAAAKSLGHWLSTGIPLVLLAPALGLLLNLEIDAYPVLVAALLAGTPAISFLGGIGAALTLRARRGGMLIALLVLPLYVPTLIFGISAVAAVVTPPGSFGASFLMLAATSLASLVLGPIAAAAAIRMQLS